MNNRYEIRHETNNSMIILSDISGANEIKLQTSDESILNDLDLEGNLTIGDNKFTINASNGNVIVDGNLVVSGIINNPEIVPFTYEPKILFGTSVGNATESTNISYAVQDGCGYTISNGTDKFCHLSIIITLTNKGTGPANTDLVWITLPSDFTALDDNGRLWTSTYETFQVGGFGGTPRRFPYCYINEANNLIVLSRWSSNTDIPEDLLTFQQIRDTSRIVINMFYKVDISET